MGGMACFPDGCKAQLQSSEVDTIYKWWGAVARSSIRGMLRQSGKQRRGKESVQNLAQGFALSTSLSPRRAHVCLDMFFHLLCKARKCLATWGQFMKTLVGMWATKRPQKHVFHSKHKTSSNLAKFWLGNSHHPPCQTFGTGSKP